MPHDAMKLTNYGGVALNIVSVKLLGLSTSNYSISDTAGNLSLPAGSATNINVTYCPVSEGPQNIVARFITDFPDTVYVNIFGFGVIPGSLQASSTVTFGPVAIQQTITYPLVIRNIGGTPVTITDQQIVGTAPVPFS